MSMSSPPKPNTTFHLFPLLPPELRLQIWSLSITIPPGGGNRTVTLRVVNNFRPDLISCPCGACATCAPPPFLKLLLTTRHESRHDATRSLGYVCIPAFTESAEWDTSDTDRSSGPGKGPPRLWVNFALDTIDIGPLGTLGMHVLDKYKSQVRRVRMESDRTHTMGRHEFRMWREMMQTETGEWKALEEVTVVARDDARFPECWRADGAFVDGWVVYFIGEMTQGLGGRAPGYVLVLRRG